MAPVVPAWDQQVRLAQPVMSLLLICIDIKHRPNILGLTLGLLFVRL